MPSDAWCRETQVWLVQRHESPSSTFAQAFTWKPEELEAWFASGGTSKARPDLPLVQTAVLEISDIVGRSEYSKHLDTGLMSLCQTAPAPAPAAPAPPAEAQTPKKRSHSKAGVLMKLFLWTGAVKDWPCTHCAGLRL